MNNKNANTGLAGLLGKGMLRMVSPGGAKGLSILIYHRVLQDKDPLFPAEVDRNDFDLQIGFLKSAFNIIPLIDAVRHTRAGTLPARAACITFDDGYADNAEVALPVLRSHGVHATFFVAAGFLNGGRMWNDTVIEIVRRAPAGQIDARALGLGVHTVGTIAERQSAIGALIGQLKYVPMEERLVQVEKLVDLVKLALPDDLMMTTAQLRALQDGGMEIGGHTVNHPILAKLDAQAARREIADGKGALEQMLGRPLRLFAYPNGKPGSDYTDAHVRMVQELGFEGAVSTSWGGSQGGKDVFQLPRFTPWDRSRGRFLLRMARNLTAKAEYA